MKVTFVQVDEICQSNRFAIVYDNILGDIYTIVRYYRAKVCIHKTIVIVFMYATLLLSTNLNVLFKMISVLTIVSMRLRRNEKLKLPTIISINLNKNYKIQVRI